LRLEVHSTRRLRTPEQRIESKMISSSVIVALLGIIVPCAGWHTGLVRCSFGGSQLPAAALPGRNALLCRVLGGSSAASLRSSAGTSRSEAESVLGRFDQEQQRIAKEGFGGVREGFGGGTSAAKWAEAHPDWSALRGAVLALSGESEKVRSTVNACDRVSHAAACAAVDELAGAERQRKGYKPIGRLMVH